MESKSQVSIACELVADLETTMASTERGAVTLTTRLGNLRLKMPNGREYYIEDMAAADSTHTVEG